MAAVILSTLEVVTAPPVSANEPVGSLQASYDRYLAAIQTARQIIQGSPFIRDAADRAQGESFLRGITTYAVAQALDLTAEQPMLQVLPHPNVRLGFNNPDNTYYTARVSDHYSYRITGQRGTSTGFLVQALSGGLPGNGNTGGATSASIASGDLHLAAGGSYSITLSAKQPPQGDWMPMMPGTDNLLVRFSFLDWKHERPGSITITRIGGTKSSHIEMTPARAATMLDDAAHSIPLQAQFYRDQGAALSALGPNKLPGPNRAIGQHGSNVQQWSLMGNFDLAADQVLLITVKDVPQAKYANIMAANLWLDSLEFLRHQSSLNHDQVRIDRDGYIRYVVSARDPGVPNWIDTTGQLHGVLFARWQEVAGELGPEYAPTLSVLNVSDVRGAVPSDTPTITPTERAKQLAQREQLLKTRFRHADPARLEILRRLHAIEALLGHELPTQYLDNEPS